MQVFQGYLDKAKNVSSRVFEQDIVIYEQNKLGLPAYYCKRYELPDGIHRRPLECSC